MGCLWFIYRMLEPCYWLKNGKVKNKNTFAVCVVFVANTLYLRDIQQILLKCTDCLFT